MKKSPPPNGDFFPCGLLGELAEGVKRFELRAPKEGWTGGPKIQKILILS
jgi:hypothetical protein